MAFRHLDLTLLATTYFIANVVIAVRFGQGPSTLSAILSIAVFDYIFVPPHFSFTVVDARYWATFAVMFLMILLTSRLTVQSRKSAQKALAAEMETERERIISSLLSSVSHDFRTPLTSISGAVSTLLEGDNISNEDRRDLLEAINEESTRLNRLIEKILQITKIESGNLHIHKEIRSLEEIIGGTVNRLRPLLKSRTITTKIPDDLGVPLDDLLIEQVMVNLLENAVRYTPENSPIDIVALKKGNQVWVEVQDRGPGISKQAQESIFEKFYRSSKRDGWGSGLGLAICQGIIKIHQGQIGVKDREGGGSIFYFSLPLGEGK